MPGLASSQSNPSLPLVPVQPLVPQETSFSPVTLTHLLLLHWLSLEQKQPPCAVHWLDVPLQLPNGQENPLGVEFGQPPSGQRGTAASEPASADVQTPPTHVVPFVHTCVGPHPPQLTLSVMKSTQTLPQIV
jgi:hypothetical protein